MKLKRNLKDMKLFWKHIYILYIPQCGVNCQNAPYKYICKYFDLPIGLDLNNYLDGKIIYQKTINEVNDLRDIICGEIDRSVKSEGAIRYNLTGVINGVVKMKEKVVFDRQIGINDLADTYRFIGGWNLKTDIILDNEHIKEFKEYILNSSAINSEAKNERSKMTPQLRGQVLARDNYTCQKCGASLYDEPNLLLEVDHIIPVSKGGKTVINNLQTLCWKCNRQKAAN